MFVLNFGVCMWMKIYEINCSLNGNVLEQVAHFKYLGCVFSVDGKMDKEFGHCRINGNKVAYINITYAITTTITCTALALTDRRTGMCSIACRCFFGSIVHSINCINSVRHRIVSFLSFISTSRAQV